MRIGRKKIDDDGQSAIENRRKAINKEVRYGTVADEKHHAVDSGCIPCRNCREPDNDAWLTGKGFLGGIW